MRKYIGCSKLLLLLWGAFLLQAVAAAQWSGYPETNQAKLLQNLTIDLMPGVATTLVGAAAEHLKLHLRYQANTIKSRRVLSHLFLGAALIRAGRQLFSEADLFDISCFQHPFVNAFKASTKDGHPTGVQP